MYKIPPISRRRSSSSWKTYTKIGATICASLGAGMIPAYSFYAIWDFCMSQVPAASEWAGLIKIALTLIMLSAGGTLTFLLSIWAAALVGALMVSLLSL